MILKRLQVWLDAGARSGPENMAVDEWLFRTADEVPILRIYRWRGDWVSLGYFQSLKTAREIFGDGPQYVRRWTGGGIVDHREDTTYTLVIPRGEPLAESRGSESYRAIHRAVADCLKNFGTACSLTGEDSQSQSSACFRKPVRWDLVADDGRKLAGAGQRRGREGILHQGSVIAPERALLNLGAHLSEECEEVDRSDPSRWAELTKRYQAADWLRRIP